MLPETQFVIDSDPSWVEIGGFILSAIGTLAAIVAVGKLFIANAETQQVIKELSKMASHHGETLEEERKNRLRKIRPYLHIKKFQFTNREKPSCTLTVLNLGETAFEMTIGQLNEKNFYIGTLSVHVMTQGGECVLQLSKVQDFKLPFVASFRDIDGNEYKQYFTADGIGYRPNTPQLILPAKDNEMSHHTPPGFLKSEAIFEHPGAIKP